MRKFIIASMFLLAMPFSVYAANGDIVGRIYSTDIRAFVNGIEVKSYSIGGKTAVAIEDIISENSRKYEYNDNNRELKFFSLDPQYLVEEKSDSKDVPGRVIGNIYETDIKTTVYNFAVPTYNIGGRMAVAIEDLGYDGSFSPIGGKYIWNSTERTINLEFLYSNSNIISRDKNITVSVNEDMKEATATFEEVLHCGGGEEHLNLPEKVSVDAENGIVIPIKADDETIGYYFRDSSKGTVPAAFTYYYPEKLKEAEKNFIPDAHKTREDIISHFINRHSSGGARERFDTDDYSFVYISVAGTSWTAYNLLQVYDDGTYIDYSDKIRSVNCSPEQLMIDKENERVTFRYTDRYHHEWFTDYEIDLKAGVIKPVSDIIGSADTETDIIIKE